MIKEIITDIQEFSPLIIEYIDWNDPILSFGSSNWSFYTISGWRFIINNKLDISCYDDIANEELNKFLNSKIVSIEIQSDHLPSDPVFVFSNKYKLEIFSVMCLEPWVFRSPTGIIHVGSPSDSKYM